VTAAAEPSRPNPLLAAMHLASAAPVVTVRLYCWVHDANHLLDLPDVERVVYALGAELVDAWNSGAAGSDNGIEGPYCWLDVLSSSRDEFRDGGYAGEVGQGVSSRAAARDMVITWPAPQGVADDV
jgi:hypothetical protein